jgi:predicted amidohydrolase
MKTGENMARRSKVAIIQQAPVFLDLDESVKKAGQLIADSAAQGASLIVFGETWFPVKYMLLAKQWRICK